MKHEKNYQSYLTKLVNDSSTEERQLYVISDFEFF